MKYWIVEFDDENETLYCVMNFLSDSCKKLSFQFIYNSNYYIFCLIFSIGFCAWWHNVSKFDDVQKSQSWNEYRFKYCSYANINISNGIEWALFVGCNFYVERIASHPVVSKWDQDEMVFFLSKKRKEIALATQNNNKTTRRIRRQYTRRKKSSLSWNHINDFSVLLLLLVYIAFHVERETTIVTTIWNKLCEYDTSTTTIITRNDEKINKRMKMKRREQNE